MTIGKRSPALIAVCGLVLVASVAGAWRLGAENPQPAAQPTLVVAGLKPADAAPAEWMRAVAALVEAKPAVETTTPKAAEEATTPRIADAIPAESDPIVVAALTPADVAPAALAAAAAAATAVDADAEVAPPPKAETPPLVEILDECFVLEVCVDHYLFELYQRSKKLDAHKVHERRKVKVKRKGKLVTVTRRVTKVVSEDFTWKDPHAAEKAGMSMMDYVIGGIEPAFKLRLLHALRAAEKEGHAPGITSGFRDDYRQSIASGTKAASNRSFHGGSLRGGYGYGLAVDIVSTNGATRKERWVTTDLLWKWVDENGVQYGVGRPYLKRDPPHVTPIDGQEYASRRGVVRFPVTAAELKQVQPAAVKPVPPKLKQKAAAQKKRAVAAAKQSGAAGRTKLAVAKRN